MNVQILKCCTPCLKKLCQLILVRERSALADPYCQSAWISIGSRALSFSGPLLSHSVEFCGFVGSRALSFSGPLLSVSVDFYMYVCMCVRNFEVQYLENQRC